MKYKIIKIPFLKYKTHCYVYGDVSIGTPIIVLHGGPGGMVEKYEPLTNLCSKSYPMIFYDQLGCGYSKVEKGHYELWNYEIYIKELENLIEYFGLTKFIILGHSWGGMLALEWVCNHSHKGLEKLILFSTLPSTKMWNDEHIKLIKDFPIEEKEALINEYEGKTFNKDYVKSGVKRFYATHVSKKKDRKYEFTRKRFPKTNKEIYEYMWGKSELFGTGTLKDWSVVDKLDKISVKTLIISGKYDESTPYMNDLLEQKIKHSKRVELNSSHHAGYVEQPEETIIAIKQFLNNE